ncbi:MAG: HWE histidine kinase domain-containing protein [Acetobacteraceae bacterium]
MIASSRPRVWRVADTYFTRIVVDWVEAVSNLTEARLGQEFLYREMAHRLKNTLTIVQALARQSLRDCRDQGQRQIV